MHKELDEASNELTSPFEGIVSASESEWASHGVKLLLALLVYGFGLGYLLRDSAASASEIAAGAATARRRR